MTINQTADAHANTRTYTHALAKNNWAQLLSRTHSRAAAGRRLIRHRGGLVEALTKSTVISRSGDTQKIKNEDGINQRSVCYSIWQESPNDIDMVRSRGRGELVSDWQRGVRLYCRPTLTAPLICRSMLATCDCILTTLSETLPVAL